MTLSAEITVAAYASDVKGQSVLSANFTQLQLPISHLTLEWSLSHWYPGSGVVLDCINF